MGAPEPPPPRAPNSVASFLRALLPANSWRSATLWLIVAVNVALIALYFWSRGGATTNVRIEAIGTHYRAFVDGRFAGEATYPGYDTGGIGLRLSEHYRLPALPRPYGVDSVLVTDAGTGDVIFEDTFDGSSSELWQDPDDVWHVRDGVFATKSSKPITTGPRPWKDYVLEAKLRNITEGAVYVRAQDTRNTVALGIGPFRALGGTALVLIQDGTTVERRDGLRVELDRGQTLQSITAMLLGPYPLAVLMIAGAILFALTVRFAHAEARLQSLGRLIADRATPIVVGMTAGTFILLWYLLYVIGDAMPHVPDSVMYVFQAKIFASFGLTADAPPVRESFEIFNPHMGQVVDDRWFSHYPFGHPLFLAVGELVHAVWLVPPVVGALTLFLTYWLGKRVYDTSAGLTAAILLMLSPFFLMTASNFMSHNTAAFMLIACLSLYLLPTKRRLFAMFFAGVFLGLLFNNRPLTAVAFIPVMGGFMAYELARAEGDRLRLAREYAAFAAGALVLFGMYLLYNNATTGEFTKSAYAEQGTYSENFFGFDGLHSLTLGIQNEQELLSLLLLVANGWPLAFGLIFAVLPFVLGTRHKWDYFFGAAFLAIIAAPIYYRSAAIMNGPRFWYEATPFLMLLTARGVFFLKTAGAQAGDWLAARLRKGPPMSASGVTSLAVYALIAGLIAFSAYGWLFEQRQAWSGAPGRQLTTFTSAGVSGLEGFNFTNDRLRDRADSMDLDNALVIVNNCIQWWCYGSVFWMNSPGLDGNIVWAEQQNNEDDLKLLESFPDRTVYAADYNTGVIQLTARNEVIAQVEAALAAKDDLPGIDATTPAERDEQRRADLAVAKEALESWAATSGSFPNTNNDIQTLCAYRTLDVGCVLQTAFPDLPNDPLDQPIRYGYWYRSDGSSFVVIAVQEATDESTGCPPDIAESDDGFGRYCVQGSLP